MNFTLKSIVNSIAAQLSEQWPMYKVYDSRTYQATTPPCFYVTIMPTTITDEIDRRAMRDVGVDVIFLQERNIVDNNALLLEIGDTLDVLMDMINYTDETGESCVLHTHERSLRIENQELHYQLHIRNRVNLAAPVAVKMQGLEDINVKVRVETTGGS